MNAVHSRTSGTSISVISEPATTSNGAPSIERVGFVKSAEPHAERFVRSVKDECLNRMIFFGEGHLRYAIDEYLAHYHGERNHQGLGNELISGRVERGDGGVVRRERLGGLLSFYERAA